jgi:bloom syndrome protein
MKKALPLKGGSAGSRHGTKSPKDLENVLKQYFGYSEFRGRQLEAIDAVLSGPLPVLASEF